MRGYVAFVKKEILESIRTYKALILFIVFFLFGMMSPLIAKLTPEIIKAANIEGMTITIPDPVVMDSYVQFYKNINQMGLIILVIIFSNIISHELVKGTLINMITKGLPRRVVILAKYTVTLLLWTIALAIAFVTTYGYTKVLFSDPVSHSMEALLCLWVFGAFLLALIIITSCITNGNYINLILVAAVVVILTIINMNTKAAEYNPMQLISSNVGIMNGQISFNQMCWPIVITCGLSVVCLYLGIILFNKKAI